MSVHELRPGISTLHAFEHGHGLSRHSESGFSHLLDTIAHAAIWSMVGRIIWNAPWLLVIVAAGGAAAWLLWSRRRARG